MRVIVVGATGTIGSAVCGALASFHEVVTVGYKDGTFHVDIGSPDSIRQLFGAIGRLDALGETDYQLGLSNKLMGQVNLVRIGRQFIADRGSFTLTSGVLSQEPMKGSASISMVNAAIEGFVRAAALELPRGIRINAVSPPWVRETLLALKMDPSPGMPAATVARAYLASIEGTATGQIIDPRKVVVK